MCPEVNTGPIAGLTLLMAQAEQTCRQTWAQFLFITTYKCEEHELMMMFYYSRVTLKDAHILRHHQSQKGFLRPLYLRLRKEKFIHIVLKNIIKRNFHCPLETASEASQRDNCSSHSTRQASEIKFLEQVNND